MTAMNASLSNTREAPVRARALAPATWSALLLSALLLLPLQALQLGIVQPVQLWAVAALALLVERGHIRASVVEALIYALFMAFALVATFFAGYPHFKTAEQLMKFGFLYPAFFLVGRSLGVHFRQTPLPYGYALLWLLLGVQFTLQYFEVPHLFRKVDFMQDALYGSFKERNWLAIYFFLASYVVFLRSPRAARDVFYFAALGVAVALLSQSKTILVPVAMAILLHVPGRLGLKALAVAAGTALYVWRFGKELTGQMLEVRLQDERGLAFVHSVALLSDNWLGYGFGFVEAHFANLWFAIKGLGLGTNSVFSSPLDLMLIAGFPGLIFWGVFFAGLGLRSFALLVPVAAWSLLNPLHQSEIVYLFTGWLVAWGLHEGWRHKPTAGEARK